MWNINNMLRILSLSSLFSILLLTSCNREEPLIVEPLTTTNVTSDAIHCQAGVSGATPDDCGFYYSTSENEVEEKKANKIQGTCTSTEISGIIGNLKPNTTYYIKAYAMNSRGMVYTETIKAKTLTRMPEASDNQYPDIDF